VGFIAGIRSALAGQVTHIIWSERSSLMSMRTIVNGFLAIIGTLVAVIFLGMYDHLKSIDDHLKSLDDHLKSLDDKFQAADRSNVKVEELFAKVSKLDEQINEIRGNVSGLLAMQKTIDDTHDAVTRLQDGQAQIKEQLDNTQNQLNQIPGMHK
jgi:uncharacterized protein YoxC